MAGVGAGECVHRAGYRTPEYTVRKYGNHDSNLARQGFVRIGRAGHSKMRGGAMVWVTRENRRPRIVVNARGSMGEPTGVSSKNMTACKGLFRITRSG